jgi:hypothetical protein
MWSDVLKQCEYFGFRQVSLFHVFSELDDIRLTFGCLFDRFLGTWNSLFLIFGSLGNRSAIR